MSYAAANATAVCHPHRRRHSADGRCEKCHHGGWPDKSSSRKATCHPDRHHQGLGLCKPCYMRNYLKVYVRPPESVQRQREGNWLRHGIKLTVAEYENLLAAQEGRCAICNQFKRLAVDHDHETGRIRGLLCDYCNRRLLIPRNTAEVLCRAADYIAITSNPVPTS